jgi:hypothetical protein
MLVEMDARKCNETVLASEVLQGIGKLGVLYMGLKEGPDSEVPRVYIQEMGTESVFFSAISQRYQKIEENLGGFTIASLRHGFYRVDGLKIIWPWALDAEKPAEFPTVAFGDIATEITIDDPFRRSVRGHGENEERTRYENGQFASVV